MSREREAFIEGEGDGFDPRIKRTCHCGEDAVEDGYCQVCLDTARDRYIDPPQPRFMEDPRMTDKGIKAMEVMIQRCWGLRPVKTLSGLLLWEIPEIEDDLLLALSMAERRFTCPWDTILNADKFFKEHVDEIQKI